MNISEFERRKPRVTHQKIERALNKYKKMVKENDKDLYKRINNMLSDSDITTSSSSSIHM